MKKSLPFLFLLITCCAFGQGSGEVIITEIYNRPLKLNWTQHCLVIRQEQMPRQMKVIPSGLKFIIPPAKTLTWKDGS